MGQSEQEQLVPSEEVIRDLVEALELALPSVDAACEAAHQTDDESYIMKMEHKRNKIRAALTRARGQSDE